MAQRGNGGITIEADKLLDLFDHVRLKKLGAKVKKVVREEMRGVKKSVTAAARGAMKRDPRRASRAVQTTIYKGGKGGVFGANVNIMPPRRQVMQMARYTNPRPGGKSGIRRHRKISQATKQRAGYVGEDRFFVLHWIDDGAQRKKRGTIPASHFFTRTAREQMVIATNRVTNRISDMIAKGGK